jgi:hypothetical protein
MLGERRQPDSNANLDGRERYINSHRSADLWHRKLGGRHRPRNRARSPLIQWSGRHLLKYSLHNRQQYYNRRRRCQIHRRKDHRHDMKTLLILLVLALPARAVISFTPGTSCSSLTAVSVKTCSVGSVTTGQLIWIGLSWAGSATGTLSVTDGVNTYTQAGTDSAATAGGTAKSSIWYTIATTTTNITATATLSVGTAFITVLPGIVTGQLASGFAGSTPQAHNNSATTITCPFTRSGNQMMTVAGNVNVGTSTWSTAGSTGTFTIGAVENSPANAQQPGVQAYQRVTSGTTINAVLSYGAVTANITCSGFAINDASQPLGPQHRVTQ